MNSMQADKGVFVISAPSGTGKTTLNRRLEREHRDRVELTVSLTTRAKRPNERDGVDYHFVTPDEFRRHAESGEMLETARVFENDYGTSRFEIDRIKRAGRAPLLEIDVQGWMRIKPKLTGATAIFILPPNLSILWQRLERRGTDSEAVRWRRLRQARTEIESGANYDFFIVNDDLDNAYRELKSIVIEQNPGHIRKDQGALLCRALLDEFDRAPWIADLRQTLGDDT